MTPPSLGTRALPAASRGNRRVVISGIGPVTSVGIGREPFFEGVWGQRVNARPIPTSFTRFYAPRSRWYVPLPEFALADYGLRLPHEQILQPEDKMVLLAARLALEDAGYPVQNDDGRLTVAGLETASLILGTGLSGMQTTFESLLCHCLTRDVVETTFPGERLRYNRMVVPRTMPNSPAAWASIGFGLGGACSTLNASCASGTYAIGEAFRRIKDGYATLVLAGGVENLQDTFGFNLRGFDALSVLTQAADGRPRPFSRNRTGFLFAEGGACLLVLEELTHAIERHAPIYAELGDYCATSDASNIVQIDPEGKAIHRLLGELAAEGKIDYLNAHGTGTLANDEVEARMIQAVFGDQAQQPWINSTKSIVGHTLGASGAIEAAVTALAVARGTVHGTITDDLIPDLNVPLETVRAPIATALSVSYGFGGHNGGLRFQRFRPDE